MYLNGFSRVFESHLSVGRVDGAKAPIGFLVQEKDASGQEEGYEQYELQVLLDAEHDHRAAVPDRHRPLVTITTESKHTGTVRRPAVTCELSCTIRATWTKARLNWRDFLGRNLRPLLPPPPESRMGPGIPRLPSTCWSWLGPGGPRMRNRPQEEQATASCLDEYFLFTYDLWTLAYKPRRELLICT